jgi:hypothetical protein
LIFHELFDRNSKNKVKFFKRTLFCFREEEKDEYCGDDIKAGKETERACPLECAVDSVKLTLMAV